jgi:predicted histidine transporter YuiF (NhaC family)
MANEGSKNKEEFVTKEQFQSLTSNLELKEKDAQHFADKFKNSLEQSVPMNDVLANAIAKLIQKNDDIKVKITEIVETVNHNKWKLIYSKTWVVVLAIVTFIVTSVSQAIINKLFL